MTQLSVLLAFRYPKGCPTSIAIFSAAVDEDLPAGVGLSPLQDVLGERGGFQLVLVKGEVPDDQGLTRGAIELDGWVG